MFVNCSIKIVDFLYYVNFIVTSLQELDIVLDMDWLFVNNVDTMCKGTSHSLG